MTEEEKKDFQKLLAALSVFAEIGFLGLSKFHSAAGFEYEEIQKMLETIRELNGKYNNI